MYPRRDSRGNSQRTFFTVEIMFECRPIMESLVNYLLAGISAFRTWVRSWERIGDKIHHQHVTSIPMYRVI